MMKKSPIFPEKTEGIRILRGVLHPPRAASAKRCLRQTGSSDKIMEVSPKQRFSRHKKMTTCF